MIAEIRSLVTKDVVLEWRQKFAFNGILLYLISTVFVCYLSFEGVIMPLTWNALFWIIMLFAATNATLKSFLQENERRQLYYYTLASPGAVIAAKIFYNACLMVLLSVIGLGVFVLFMGNVIQSTALFFLVMLPGVVALSSVLSMVSAIASRARNNFTLMAVLGFPLVLPLLLVVIKSSAATLQGTSFTAIWPDLLVIMLLLGITFVLALILFPFIWKE